MTVAQRPRDGAPWDLALDEARHRRHVEDAGGVLPAAEHDPVQAERLADAEAEHAGQIQIGPQVDEAADAHGRIGEVGGEEARVDGADRGAAEDVDARRGAARAREGVQHVREHADLVGPARAAAREDERDLALARATAAAHEVTAGSAAGGGIALALPPSASVSIRSVPMNLLWIVRAERVAPLEMARMRCPGRYRKGAHAAEGALTACPMLLQDAAQRCAALRSSGRYRRYRARVILSPWRLSADEWRRPA